MHSLKTLAASYRLSSKLDPEKCERAVNSLGIKRSGLLDYVYPNNVRLSAVHYRLAPYKDAEEMIKEISRLVEAAVQAGSHLVLFPHLTGLLPLTVDKGAVQAVEAFLAQARDGKAQAGALREHFRHLADRFADFLFDCYYNTFLLLAHKYNIYIAGGSTYIASGQGLFCRSYLFCPELEEALFQDKLHLSPLERRVGLSAGDTLEVFPTKIGKLALLTDCDSSFYECFKVAKALGAQLVLTPAMHSESLSHCPAHNTSLLGAQHFNLYTARASFYSTGEPYPVLEGASGIYGPLGLTKDLNGILVHSHKLEEKSAVLSARIDPPKLPENMDVYMHFTNPAFSSALLDEVYPAFFRQGAPQTPGQAPGEGVG